MGLNKLCSVADVVGFVVLGVGEDHEDAIGGEIVHLMPEARTDDQAFGGRIEDDTFFTPAVEEAEPDGARDADAELAKLLMGMEAAAHAGRGAVNPVDPTDYERQCPAKFGDGEPAAGVSALRDWH